ncbi:hypothetical protein DM02DRAFT_69553 [Periconia macrospinosa]|uniref:Uncharacterized protein n=1 Tax=Periconia macrospinosa TaxID=97972 RepID=A0A2V1E5C7_9PLEO|nr:hypothetical protein DM02DRAFT_69553 [Periconia macrospinosa]
MTRQEANARQKRIVHTYYVVYIQQQTSSLQHVVCPDSLAELLDIYRESIFFFFFFTHTHLFLFAVHDATPHLPAHMLREFGPFPPTLACIIFVCFPCWRGDASSIFCIARPNRDDPAFGESNDEKCGLGKRAGLRTKGTTTRQSSQRARPSIREHQGNGQWQCASKQRQIRSNPVAS